MNPIDHDLSRLLEGIIRQRDDLQKQLDSAPATDERTATLIAKLEELRLRMERTTVAPVSIVPRRPET